MLLEKPGRHVVTRAGGTFAHDSPFPQHCKCHLCNKCVELALYTKCFCESLELITELKMTKWKTTVHISSSSQSSIATLKNVLADGRLTSSPPLPHTTHRMHPPTTLIPYPYTYWGSLWVSQRVGGWVGKGSRASQTPVP